MERGIYGEIIAGEAVNTNGKLTMNSFFIFLREKFLEAREAKDEELLRRLENAFYLIEDAAAVNNDRKYIGMTDHMVASVHDYFYGTEWKSTIPTIEQIEDDNYEP
jgi:hypothetical protein